MTIRYINYGFSLITQKKRHTLETIILQRNVAPFLALYIIRAAYYVYHGYYNYPLSRFPFVSPDSGTVHTSHTGEEILWSE